MAGCSLATGAVPPAGDSGRADAAALDTSLEIGPVDSGNDADASLDADSSRDSVTPRDVGPIDAGTFGTPTMFYTVPQNIDDPTLTGDMLELYFNSTRDIWVMTRSSVSGAWDTARVVAELSTAGVEGTPEIHPDGLSIWFHSDRAPSLGSNDVWRSDRTSRTAAWGTPVYELSLSTPGADSAPSVTRDALLGLTDFDPPTGASDMQVHTRTATTDSWTTARALSELNSLSTDTNPSISADGLVVVFDSNRPGGLGMQDIYIAARTSRADTFGPPELLAEVSSAERDVDPWISPDASTLVFVSRRSGMSAFYEVRR